jgi:hypothetical protein
MFPSSGDVWETPTLLDPLGKNIPNYWTSDVSPPPEDGNRSSYRNVCSFVFLEHRTIV